MRLGKVIREFRAVPARLPGDPPAEPAGDPPLERGVLGWRCWRVRKVIPDGWHLASVSAPYLWTGPAVRDDDPPPATHVLAFRSLHAWQRNGSSSGLTLGFHAYRSWERPAELAGRLASLSYPAGVFGPCELLGRVVEHEDGYRAQGMAVRKLFVVSGLPRELARQIEGDLERRYACEVQPLEWPQELGAEALAPRRGPAPVPGTSVSLAALRRLPREPRSIGSARSA